MTKDRAGVPTAKANSLSTEISPRTPNYLDVHAVVNIDGVIDIDGRISKPLTGQDREKLNRGKIMARKILKNIGATDIWNGALGAAHPGGTCRIGHIVDANLETRYKNLFVSDGSVIPFEFGLPPVLTIISLSRRLSGHLLRQVL